MTMHELLTPTDDIDEPCVSRKKRGTQTKEIDDNAHSFKPEKWHRQILTRKVGSPEL